MSESKQAWLALENGEVFEGLSVGAEGEKGGELVFNTAMTGYQEILTDPSYAGQAVCMTYPMIGNYGICPEDSESARAWPEAFVMREVCRTPSNHRSQMTLPDWLMEQGIVAIEGVDTRRITHMVREHGSLRCIVSTEDSDPKSLVQKAKQVPGTAGRDLAAEVSCKKPYTWNEGYEGSYPTEMPMVHDERLKVVAIDTGIKRNILRSLVHVGFDVTVVPSSTSADEILALDPDCIFLSNGPGDPSAAKSVIESASVLVSKKPVFGICLGHQILSIVFGAKTFKMPFGHHGANHPVRDETTGRVEISSQNHSYAVELESMPKELELTHINLNDNTVAGMRHRQLPVFSVQYHPEAAPGPLDSTHLFMRFRELVLDQRSKV
ncbi:MAG: glutamine-hydrolyzing carbamoyl-phosphate synthase small subunit [Planctomycetota bacterium]|nr:glutamine-hydrolyzing carbamoyl-phosphate synthase small subunit [Planctomycetota bacterium]